MNKQFWETKEHPIVGGIYRSWEDEIRIKDNVKLQKIKKEKQNENTI